MDKIRLGNDIEMRWSIFTRDGDNKVPYNLEGRALTLSVVNRTGESEIEFFAEGNIVTGVFRGRDQRILGKHGVILRENNGEEGMRTIDACDAFELVACSCEEALGSPGTIQLFHLTFDSTIGAITGTIDPILNHEAEQAEAERKTNEIIRKANEQQRIDNEKQRDANEILRNIAEEERKNAEQERIVNEDLRKADEAERKTNEESRLQSESERVSSEEERLYAESIRVANENTRIASEAKRAEAETARIEAEDKRIVSEKNRLSAESSRIANEDSRRANEDSRLSAEAKRVSAEEERKAKFASMVVQSTGDATDKVMSQKSVTEALKGKQNKLTAGKGISIDGDVISATLDMDIVRVVDALPSVGEANIIYLVPAEQPSESDLFEEWVWTDRWERIGSAKIDLSDYATKGYVDSKISSTEENLVHKDGFERITAIKQFQKGIGVGLFNTLVANDDGVQSGAWLDQNEDPAPFIVADPSADDHAATKYYVDEGLATKQDTLTAGNGISIEGNEIGVTTITESESQPNSSLWINPSEDTETDVTYNRSQIDAMLGAKQDALQLTVKDNGNIVLSNIQGQSKEFMPATPSGDPMHYAYVAAGAEYNDTGADIIKTTPWADLADDDADKTVIHKTGYWYLNGLGDITNEQMRDIYNTTINFGISHSMNESFKSSFVRTNYFLYYRKGTSAIDMYQTFYESNIEVGKICSDYVQIINVSTLRYFASYNHQTKHFIGKFNVQHINSNSNIENAFIDCTSLKTINIYNLKLSISFSETSMLTSKSVLYMINNEAATSPITITLHADAYARAMANADIVAALEAHPNVSLASA